MSTVSSRPENGTSMTAFSRRRLLGGAAASALAAVLPPNLRRALAAEPTSPGSLRDIKHIVVLMQENRSFDHYFGTMPGVRGFDDPHAITLPSGSSVFYQPDAAATRTATCCRSTWTPSTPARRPSRPPATPGTVQHAALERRQDGQLVARAPRRRRRRPRPVHDGLLRPRTTSRSTGRWPTHSPSATPTTARCSGPTWPNRLYLMTGHDRPGRPARRADHRNVVPAPLRLDHLPGAADQGRASAGSVYQEDDNYGLQPAGVLQGLPGRPARLAAVPERPDASVRPASSSTTRCTTGCRPCRGSCRPSPQSEHPDYMPGRRGRLRGRQARRDRRQPRRVGQDRVHPQLRRERRPVRPRGAADAARRHARTSS